MKKIIFSVGFLLTQLIAVAQFAPPAGQAGSTAIYKDSSIFVAWATRCSIVRGFQDISNPSLGYAITGDSTMATGLAGENGVVSLGDGGYAILTFANAIIDGAGWDFAVFENSFSDSFLELAFVEVSSDGINYFRFPSTSNTQDTLQIESFGLSDATNIDNLAGKYRALYGTPFDLQQLSSQAGLNVNAITHVKIIDVVGSILSAYATYDQYGNIINDPWNTPFESSGFDLDAVGVINSANTSSTNDLIAKNSFNMYPNPAKDVVSLELSNVNQSELRISIVDYTGKEIIKAPFLSNQQASTIQLNIDDLNTGLYFISVLSASSTYTQKLIISND